MNKKLIALALLPVLFVPISLVQSPDDPAPVEPVAVAPAPKPVTLPPPPAESVVVTPIAVIVEPEPEQVYDLSGVPRLCLQYKRRIIRESRNVWGLDGFPATFAAQIQQESACKPDAVSRVGAQGLAQFMPSTAEWFGNEIMKEEPAPLDPDWAIRAMVQYNRFLWVRVNAADTCNRAAKMLSAYNGGLGWIKRDEKLATSKGLDKDLWFGNVETVNSGRSAANFKENRGYPRRIMLKIEPSYVRAGYGEGAGRGTCGD